METNSSHKRGFFKNLLFKAPKKSDEYSSDIIEEASLKIPVHLAVIMDGNGRWAKNRHLPRSAGHRAGAENLKVLCRNCGHFGIRFLTVYAFSTENWSRPESEVSALMDLFVEFFNRYDPELEKEGIRVRFSGDIPSLPPRIRDVCKEAEERSVHRNRMDLIIAMNYGGRKEITDACRKVASLVSGGEVTVEDIDEAMISRNLYLPDVPDPDLIIRPSGEQRLSNFLIWEAAYAEMWFSNTLWPDFGMDDLKNAIAEYTKRDRRFGGLNES
ncbi:MAG: isoprenyl transferase [Clostridiaceae bacterium]|nr:isoprenyl transferase [Clostridiaceae bacterium]